MKINKHEIYENALIVFVIIFSPIILPLWILHAIVVNYYPCSWFGKFTEYAHCEDSE